MNKPSKNPRAPEAAPTLHTALSSPMRLELLGLFTDPGPLSIADMAARLGRPATSLYHHVQVLEDAGALRRAGTRPKGKRFETLFEPAENRLELSVDPDDGGNAQLAGRTLAAALRMAERDFFAALDRDDIVTDGPHRNLTGLRAHLRLSPEKLAELNERLRAVEEFLQMGAVVDDEARPDDLFVSFTFLLAPLRGRRVADDAGPIPYPGDPS